MLFEIMSGLKVNYQKSSLVGVNINQRWLDEAARTLNSSIGSYMFKYLGLPIGSNPKIIDTWN